jgi:hypothetical protein
VNAAQLSLQLKKNIKACVREDLSYNGEFSEFSEEPVAFAEFQIPVLPMRKRESKALSKALESKLNGDEQVGADFEESLMWAGIVLRHESFQPIKQRQSPAKGNITGDEGEGQVQGSGSGSGSNNISVGKESSTHS